VGDVAGAGAAGFGIFGALATLGARLIGFATGDSDSTAGIVCNVEEAKNIIASVANA